MKVFNVVIKDGRIDFGSEYNKARFQDFCIENEGKKLRIELPKPIRSLSQNALYWVYLTKIELETGNSSNALHEFFKSACLPKRLIKIKGKKQEHEIETVGSTTGLNKSDFAEYMMKIEAMTEIQIPSKEEAEAMGYILNK